MSDSDLSDSDEEGGGGRKRRKKKRKKVVDDDDGSDGYELSLSDAEDELKRKKKVKRRGARQRICVCRLSASVLSPSGRERCVAARREECIVTMVRFCWMRSRLCCVRR